jgi:hypothetical protein
MSRFLDKGRNLKVCSSGGGTKDPWDKIVAQVMLPYDTLAESI